VLQDSGGLIIYTKPAPLNWPFDQMNSEEGVAAMETLVEDSAKVIVPCVESSANNSHTIMRCCLIIAAINCRYRENRIVLFKSDLLHTTDHFTFKPGFKNRRINLTFLYGLRGQGDDPITLKQRTEESTKQAASGGTGERQQPRDL
jgi:hypothetical protein